MALHLASAVAAAVGTFAMGAASAAALFERSRKVRGSKIYTLNIIDTCFLGESRTTEIES